KAEDPLFEIHDLAHVWVQGYVSEQGVAAVKIGQAARVRFTAAPGVVAGATVMRRGGAFGAEDRTLSVWAGVKGTPPPGLQHNMLATLTVTVDESAPTLAVPLAAVVREEGQVYVFVRKADGTFERRAVTTGRSDDRYIEVAGGLDEGEPVAVRGAEH